MPHKPSRDGELSVTEVLSLAINKPFLNFWYGRHGTTRCEQIKRESQELGIAVHKEIETYFTTGRCENTDDNVARMTRNFINMFASPQNVKPLALEVELVDKELKLHGSFDAVILTSQGEAVADWKTSNQLDVISVPLQLAAYDYLRKGNGRGVAVRIDKTKDKIEVVWYENLKQYWPVFLTCLRLARYIKFGEIG